MSALAPLGALPHYASRLVGRDAEIALIRRLIADEDIPIITIAGTAGVGKSRLAATVARIVADDFEDGVVFVPLATITDPELVPAEIAKALGLMQDLSISAIKAHLAAWNGILFLDNLEQVIDAAVDIAALIPFNPNMTVLVTSQRPLQIAGERVIRLHPLPIPDDDASEADIRKNVGVQLLLDRAANLDSFLMDDLEDPATIQVVGEICRRLDGIPLALELAAPRLMQFSPEVVLAQLDRGNDILSGSSADAPERHRTMHSAIGWSYQLLPPDLQKIFLYLGAFPSGFNLAVSENVATELGFKTPAVDVISELFNFNLVRRATAGADPWYVMLESIRMFCLAELDASGERDAAETMVTQHVLHLAERTQDEAHGPNQLAWTTLLNRQWPTIRTAVAWARDRADAVTVIKVASGLSSVMEREGRGHEALDWLDDALVHTESLPEEILIAGLLARLTLLEDARRLTEATATAEEVRILLDGKDLPKFQVQYLLRAGNIAQNQQDFTTAEDYYRQARSLATDHNLERFAAVAGASLGFIAYFRGDYLTAYNTFQSSKRILEQIRDYGALTTILSNLAAACINLDNPEEALEYLDESIQLSRESQSKRDLIYPLLNKAGTLIALKEYEEAESVGMEALQLSREINQHMLEAVACLTLADVSLIKRAPAMAGEWLRQALAVITPEEGMRIYAEMGWLLAHALGQQERYPEAAAMLARSVTYAAENDVVIEHSAQERINEVEEMITTHLPDVTHHRQTGECWSGTQYLRNLQWYAQRVANRAKSASTTPSFLLVKVGEANADPGLTAREREILQLLVDGKSTRQMADILSISPRTVTTHLANMMAKMEVSSRSELVARALRNI